MPVSKILKQNSTDLALVIGNGINRYGQSKNVNSWGDLLETLAKRHLGKRGDLRPEDVALTELFDLIELVSKQKNPKESLQSEFCNLLSKWESQTAHLKIVSWARRHGAPVLTTNFDELFSSSEDLPLSRAKNSGFTHYYPWELYYGLQKHENVDVSSHFGVWHINGMLKYPHSLRLGLTHYMGSVERARKWIHRGYDDILFTGKNRPNWPGAKSWLHIVFNKPLLFFGLALDEQEVFLRWLLIERAKYFNKFPARKRSAWFVYKSDMEPKKKLYFLESVGVKTIAVNDFQDIYDIEAWKK